MKRLYFVSTGRCGTHRIHEILSAYLPGFDCVHHFPYSRIAYVLGNMLFRVCRCEWLNRVVFRLVTGRRDRSLPRISADGRILMMFPDAEIRDAETGFIHVSRNDEAFARSMFNFSRKNIGNMLAHNVIPFWQLHLWPFENLLNPRVLDKYARISRTKNDYFTRLFSRSSYYVHVKYEDLFRPGVLDDLVNDFFGTELSIDESELKVKANASTARQVLTGRRTPR